MLILSRYVGQSLRIGEQTTITLKMFDSSTAVLTVIQGEDKNDVVCPLSKPISLAQDITISFSTVTKGQVKLGIQAPKELKIVRLSGGESNEMEDSWSAYLEKFKTLDTTKNRIV